MRAAAIILIVSLAAISRPCAGMEISRVVGCTGGDVLTIRGDIEAGDYVKFRSYFGDQRRIIGLDLNSPGGSLYEGFRIAMLTRQRRLSTYVSKECASACAFIFFMGKKRYISKEAKIGVHAVGNGFGGEDRGTIWDTIYFARLSAKFGIPSSTIGKMVATPPNKITFLTQADLASLKAIVRDPFARNSSADDPRSCRNDGDGSVELAGKTTPIAATKTLLRVPFRTRDYGYNVAR